MYEHTLPTEQAPAMAIPSLLLHKNGEVLVVLLIPAMAMFTKL